MKMSNELQILIEKARCEPVSDAHREAQRRSFAYGNTAIENDRITRDMIDRQAEMLKAVNE
jgi:hypothetical protein